MLLHCQYFYAILLFIIFFLSWREKRKNILSRAFFFFKPSGLFTYEISVCVGRGKYQGKKIEQFIWKGNSAFHEIFFSVPSHSCVCSSPAFNVVSSPNSLYIYSLCLRIWHLIIVRSSTVLCGLVLSTQIQRTLFAGMSHILYSITPGWINSSSQNSNTF